MRIFYYPGCTLKTKAKNLGDSALAVSEALDIEMVEMSTWNCCGTVYSLATDDLIHKVAPLRNLIRAKEQDEDRVVTLCSMCYNTLKRANLFIQSDPLSHRRLNNFLECEKGDYNGEVKVVHLLEILRDEVGFDQLPKKIEKPLEGLKIASYYGCLLLRPSEVGLDDPEGPSIVEDMCRSAGASVIDSPFKTECCGAYQTVNDPELVVDRAHLILEGALRRGAEMIVLSCPLCSFNLDRRQRDVRAKYLDFRGIPVVYFTQLLAVALGLEEKFWGFDLNYADPRPLLRSKGLI